MVFFEKNIGTKFNVFFSPIEERNKKTIIYIDTTSPYTICIIHQKLNLVCFSAQSFLIFILANKDFVNIKIE